MYWMTGPCSQLSYRRNTASTSSSSHSMPGVAAAPSAPAQARDRWNITYYPKGADAAALQKQWYIIDAEGQTLGRLATLAATHIRGKNSPTPPHLEVSEQVIPELALGQHPADCLFQDPLWDALQVGRVGGNP